MISVCIATYNGERYIKVQLISILNQLGQNDELIISDDNSTDSTLEIVNSLIDPRIKIIINKRSRIFKTAKNHHYATLNFENALIHAKGEYIFLSDQDDIWLENKVSSMIESLNTYALVICDCEIIDNNYKVIYSSYFKLNQSRSGIIRNLYRSRFHGCCMAFTREVLDRALPFPKRLVMHDAWLGLIAESFFPVKFLNKKLVLYRVHDMNASGDLRSSSNSLFFKINYRLYMAIHLFGRFIKYSISKN